MVNSPLLCRLCQGTLEPRFRGRLLGRHDVQYHACSVCGSLQTEPPYWLQEAYAEGGFASIDTGAVQRNLDNLGACLALARWLKLQTAVDHGGGDGLLCRMLRDRGLDAHVVDRYAQPRYAAGFDNPGPQTPDLVLAFEVAEHYPEPAVDFGALFQGSPRAVLITTEAWREQGPDWDYLSPRTGQHIFFYTPRALQMVAAQQGYGLLSVGGYWLFTRAGAWPKWRLKVARRLLKHRLRLWRTAWACSRPTTGLVPDHEVLLARMERAGRADGTIPSL